MSGEGVSGEGVSGGVSGEGVGGEGVIVGGVSGEGVSDESNWMRERVLVGVVGVTNVLRMANCDPVYTFEHANLAELWLGYLYKLKD